MAPSQVLSSLNDEDAKAWVEEFNKAIPKENPSLNDVMAARRHAWFSVKDRPSSFSFCIKASVEEIDKQKEIITVDSIKKHMDSFLSYGGNINADHGNYNVGCVWGWDPVTVKGKPGVQIWGNLFGGDQVYDKVRKAFVDGMNSVSIAGEATPGKFTCDDNGCYSRRDMTQIMEISLTRRPVNTNATMIWYNNGASITKSEETGLTMDVDEYIIHKSESECPILALKKSLRDAGFDAHARREGCFIPDSSIDTFLSAIKAGVSCEAQFDPKLDTWGIFVPTRESRIRKAFDKLYSHDMIDMEGVLKSMIPESTFRSLWEGGLIEDEGDRFRLIRP